MPVNQAHYADYLKNWRQIHYICYIPVTITLVFLPGTKKNSFFKGGHDLTVCREGDSPQLYLNGRRRDSNDRTPFILSGQILQTAQLTHPVIASLDHPLSRKRQREDFLIFLSQPSLREAERGLTSAA